MSVVASLVVGRDGSISKDHRSRGISSPADRARFLERRKIVDVIIIGGNTARREPYNKTPVPLVVVSRNLVNPVQGNHLAHFWNCTPAAAIERAEKLFGKNILIEGGISFINDLIIDRLIDRIELSVTPIIGGDLQIDWQELLANFKNKTVEEVDGTQFYSASN